MFSGKKYRGNCVDILPSYVYNKFNKIDLQKYFAKINPIRQRRRKRIFWIKNG